MSDRVTLKIPRPLYDRLRQVIQNTGYRSVNEFVVYVLRDLLSEESLDVSRQLTVRETELIRQRLRRLGYLEK